MTFLVNEATSRDGEALKKDVLRASVAEDTRDVAKGAAGSKCRMRNYQVKFPEPVMARFRAFRESRGLSLSAGTRLAVMEYMERSGLK